MSSDHSNSSDFLTLYYSEHAPVISDMPAFFNSTNPYFSYYYSTPTNPAQHHYLLHDSITESDETMPSLISEFHSIPDSTLFYQNFEIDSNSFFENEYPFTIHHYFSQIMHPSIQLRMHFLSIDLPLHSFTEIILKITASVQTDHIDNPLRVFIKITILFMNIPPIADIYFHYAQTAVTWEEWVQIRRQLVVTNIPTIGFWGED